MNTEQLDAALAGQYRVQYELGTGGMATVYLAEDLRHGRKVAIKVLHPELAAVLGPERFLAEIRLTAALQHPHILPLFDSGVVQSRESRVTTDLATRDSSLSTLYYVMPYVDGETLRARLAREGQLPVADALRIAAEVADALEYAHRSEVIHRDIKPENILLRDGHALVADFGIALAVQHAGGERMTQTGLSLGTPQYMAPEQAMGERNIDRRADIYALGAVTYEMLAGEPPFTGPNAQAITAKVITEQPKPLSRLRPTTPPEAEDAVMTALQKLPADRFASAQTFAAALGDGRPAGVTRAGREPARSPWVRRAAVIGAAALALILAAAAYFVGRRAAPEPQGHPSRLALFTPGLGGTGVAALFRQVALTPAGDALVYVTVDGENANAVAYQPLDAEGPRLIDGARGLLNPYVSPDGRTLIGWLAGLAQSVHERSSQLPMAGGSPLPLPTQVRAIKASWAPDGTFWFSPSNGGGISRMDPGGEVVPMLGGRADGLQVQQVFDGRQAMVVRAPIGTASGPVLLVDLETGTRRTLVEAATVEARVAAGHLLSVRSDGTIWAAPFDERRLEPTGQAVRIASGVSLTGTGLAQWAVAANGTVAYVPEEPRGLVLVTRDGAARPATAMRQDFHSPRFSPDGQRIAVDFTSADGRDVWVLSPAQGTLTRATFTRDGHDASWLPDRDAFTFSSLRDGMLRVLVAQPGRGGPPDSLIASPRLAYSGVWLPDAGSIVTVIVDSGVGGSTDIGIIDGGGRGPIRPIVADGFESRHPAVSPDGRWLAYTSDRSGTQQVYARPLAGGIEIQVSLEGGTEPVWSRNGRELFYVSTGGGGLELVAAAVRRVGDVIEVTGRERLFAMPEMVGANPHANYDVSPDGRTFVMVTRSPANRIMVLQNLRELVRRAQGAGG